MSWVGFEPTISALRERAQYMSVWSWDSDAGLLLVVLNILVCIFNVGLKSKSPYWRSHSTQAFSFTKLPTQGMTCFAKTILTCKGSKSIICSLWSSWTKSASPSDSTWCHGSWVQNLNFHHCEKKNLNLIQLDTCTRVYSKFLTGWISGSYCYSRVLKLWQNQWIQ
jgi:hypothetical protein